MQNLNSQQLKLILQYLITKRHQNDWCLIIEVLTRSGARSHELTTLTIDSIDVDRQRLTIQGAKNSNTREVPVDKGCLQALRTRMLQCGSVLGVFSQNSAASFKRRLREQWDIIRLECFGILGPKCTLHGLRATFAMSQYQALDCDILLVKQLLGHKSINSTMHYVHAVNLDEMQKRILSVYTRKPNKKAG